MGYIIRIFYILHMHIDADILENDMLSRYPGILDILLCDRTIQKNIFWATENYIHL
jgi:hypothetical protein